MTRIRSNSHRAGLLTGALILGSLSGVALPTMPAQAQERAISALLDQANFWKLQNRPDQVVRVLERVLLADPTNAEALAGLAEAQAQQGNAAAAQEALTRLRNIAPSDPRTNQADTAVRTQTVDAAALAQARQLAQSGRGAEAVERYRSLFRNGQVPDSFALEYYQTLAGTEGGWREARDGLADLARRAPSNSAVQLAYAQVLTYREETRAQGLEILRRLSGQPDSQQSATAAWRQALTWLGSGPEAVQPLEGYLRQYPNDAEMRRRLEEALNPSASAGDARTSAWAAFRANNLRKAETQFQAALAANPQDADALGGMGLIRARQGRRDEARRLLTAAIEAEPSTRANWQRALDGLSGRGGGGGSAGSNPELQQARNLVEEGKLSEATPVLTRIIRRNGGDRPDAEALMGDIALRQGNAMQAEEFYRAALSRRSNFGAAMSGLASAYQAQGRFAEAEDILRRLGQVEQPQVRAEALRAEAARTQDPAAAAALLRTAMQTEPNNPWPRLDLARLLQRNGQAAEARALMDQIVAGPARPEALHAAALFASEQRRFADAAALLERIPAGQRSAEMNRSLATARLEAEVGAAALLATQGRRGEARQRLMAIASRRDPTGEAASAAVRALTSLNDTVAAQQAARAAAIAARGQPPVAQLAAAGALMQAGLDQEAAMLAASIDASRLTAEQRRSAQQLQAGLAIRASDQLNSQGDQATAYEVLAPTLRQDPQNIAANLALARLYQRAGEAEQAQRIAEAVLQRNPRDADARQAAVDAAIANRDWSRAEALLSEGRALLPGDPRMPMLEARLARAWGDQRRAQAALEEAARLRQRQIGLDPRASAAFGTTAPQATVPQQPVPGTDNPFRRVPLSGSAGYAEVAQAPLSVPPAYLYQAPQFAQAPSLAPQPQPMQGQQFAQAMIGNSTPAPPDPLLSEITRQLQEVREEAAPRVTPSFGLRTRSGDAGIDRLMETTAGAEGSVAMPGIGGRLTARASAVNADIGQLAGSLGSMRRFGTNPSMLPGLNGTPSAAQVQQATNTESSQTGLALGLAYTRPNFSVDVGSTPMGFNQTNIVGGIEIAPEISEGVRVRITAERRALMDSLLSWGGLRDPGSGREWGGVTRSGGRVQLEMTQGDNAFYVAGGYYVFDGTDVAENSRIELGAGFSTPVWRGATDELVTGLDIVYFAYDKNLRFFTYGHGGYFSPQSFIAANVPVDYRGRSGNFTYRLGGSLGFATFTEDRTPIYPNDPNLQAGLVQRVANGESGVDTFFAGQSKSGVVGSLRGDIEYMVTPQLRIGTAMRLDQAADWSEARAFVYARYRFTQ